MRVVWLIPTKFFEGCGSLEIEPTTSLYESSLLGPVSLPTEIRI